jgi:predicted permease
VDTLLQNLRYAFRSLSHAPGFALTATLTLALGIGLATAVFTVADALLLRPLPVRDQNRIVVLWGKAREGAFNYPIELDDSREFARQARTLERIAFVSYYGAIAKPIRDGDQVSRLSRALVSGEFFDVLGARPVLGRGLRSTDDVSGAAPVAVLSYAAWQRRFGGDPTILGRQVITYDDGIAFTIVGVMPQGLDYPRGTDFWTAVVPSTVPKDLYLIGRLAPGATIIQARDELTAFFGRVEASPWQRDLRGAVHTLPRLVLGETRPALIVFAAAAGLLLLITCVNVANLQLVRGLTRAREIAVRSALGAGRRQIIGQLLTESALLAITGGALGVALASVAAQVFVAVAPVGVPRLDEIQLNMTALTAAVGITAVAMLIFAVVPAVVTSRVGLEQVLRSDARHSPARRSRLGAEALVAGQIALALLVLSAAGLIARSLVKLERAELSFDASHLLIGDLTLRFSRYGDQKEQLALLDRVVSHVERIPGVRGVSPVVAIPFSGFGGWDGRPAAEGQSAAEAAANPVLNMEVVTPAYFEAFGIQALRGRVFTDADREGAPLVVVVSQSAARHYWGTDEPMGKSLRFGEHLERTLTVVGVVPDTRYRDLREARASVYFPLRQSFFPFTPMTLAIRTTGPPGELVSTIRRVISETEPGVALVSAAPFESFLDGPLAQPRLNALLLAMFAGAAVALAAVGLFGTVTTMVRQRTRELGLRLALGATAGELRRMVMRRGLAIAVTGSGFGLCGALLTNRLLSAMLYNVTPTDLATLTGVTGFLIVVAALASFVPARATTRIDPMVALRTE